VLVDEEVVNVDDGVLEISENSFHQLLKRGRTVQESLRRGDPLEFAFSGNGESGEWL
jgi:hypothetical protein